MASSPDPADRALDQRIPEPELMDEASQAEAYARADFTEPNSAFVGHLETLFPTLPPAANVLDLGCGPGDIPVRLARRHGGWTVLAVDGAPAMLALANRAIADAGLADRIETRTVRIPDRDALPRQAFDIVVSNSLLHHLPDPSALWRTIRWSGRHGAAVMIMDLTRPATEARARSLVDAYAADEPEVLRRDFLMSLRAAFRPREIRDQLEAAGLPHLLVDEVSDRHVLVHGIL
jgi:2-polyprenyl-3-methyl-5-hydroxy-6-metoxy-1,4-benzoquinol methylase